MEGESGHRDAGGGPGETYTPLEAARILSRSGKSITERRVRQLLQSGELEGEQTDTGRWRVYAESVLRMLEERREVERVRRETGSGPPEAAESPDRVRELLERVEDLSRERGRLEGRLELTERAESTMRAERERALEDLRRERERADRLEEELREARRPWWKRMFGG